MRREKCLLGFLERWSCSPPLCARATLAHLLPSPRQQHNALLSGTVGALCARENLDLLCDDAHVGSEGDAKQDGTVRSGESKPFVISSELPDRNLPESALDCLDTWSGKPSFLFKSVSVGFSEGVPTRERSHYSTELRLNLDSGISGFKSWLSTHRVWGLAIFLSGSQFPPGNGNHPSGYTRKVLVTVSVRHAD